MAYNQYDFASTTLNRVDGLREVYIPLWNYSINSATTTSISQSYLLKKGSITLTSFGAGSTATSVSSASFCQLHTLNNNWSKEQQFAFEAAIYAGSSTAYAELWDMTANTAVAGSKISTASASYAVIRSSAFSLVPGHMYGVCLWIGVSSATAYLSRAYIVALLS